GGGWGFLRGSRGRNLRGRGPHGLGSNGPFERLVRRRAKPRGRNPSNRRKRTGTFFLSPGSRRRRRGPGQRGPQAFRPRVGGIGRGKYPPGDFEETFFLWLSPTPANGKP